MDNAVIERHDDRFWKWKRGFDEKLKPQLPASTSGEPGTSRTLENDNERQPPSPDLVVERANLCPCPVSLVVTTMKIEHEDLPDFRSPATWRSQESDTESWARSPCPAITQPPSPAASVSSTLSQSSDSSRVHPPIRISDVRTVPGDGVEQVAGPSNSTSTAVSTRANENSSSTPPDIDRVMSQIMHQIGVEAHPLKFFGDRVKFFEANELELKWEEVRDKVLADADTMSEGANLAVRTSSLFEKHLDFRKLELAGENRMRRHKHKLITDIFGERFGPIEKRFDESWLHKTLSEIQDLYMDDNAVEMLLVEQLGQDWKQLYYQLKREKTERLYSVVKALKEYQKRMEDLLDEHICCHTDGNLSNFHETASSTSAAALQLDGLDQDLIAKANSIVQDVRSSMVERNRKALELESELARRAVQYALAQYRALIQQDLVNPLQVTQLTTAHQKVASFIEESFFDVPDFVYTEPWNVARQILIEAFEVEFEDVARQNAASIKVQEAQWEKFIVDQTAMFRKQIRLQISRNPQIGGGFLLQQAEEKLSDALASLLPLPRDVKRRLRSRLYDRLIECSQKVLQIIPPIPRTLVAGQKRSFASIQPTTAPNQGTVDSSAALNLAVVPARTNASRIFSDPSSITDCVEIEDRGVGIYFHGDKVTVMFKDEEQDVYFTKKMELYLKQMEECPVSTTKEDCDASHDVWSALNVEENARTDEKYFFTYDEGRFRSNKSKVPLWSEEILALFLYEVASSIKREWNKCIGDCAVAISLPTNFIGCRRQRLKSALVLAQIPNVIFVQPTTAIALSEEPMPTEYLALSVYMEPYLLDVAVVLVLDGKVVTKTVESDPAFPDITTDNIGDITQSLKRTMELAVAAANLTMDDMKKCFCAVFTSELFSDPESNQNQSLKSSLKLVLLEIISSTTELKLVTDGKDLLNGLHRVSNSAMTSKTKESEIHQDVHPTEINIVGFYGSPQKKVTWAEKNNKMFTKQRPISIKTIGDSENPTKIVSYAEGREVILLQMSIKPSVRETNGDSHVEIKLDKNGIVTKTTKTKRGRNAKKISITTTCNNMAQGHLNKANGHVQAIIKATKDVLEGLPEPERNEGDNDGNGDDAHQPPEKRRKSAIACDAHT